MLLMSEKGIKGGFSGVLKTRHVKAFNKYTPNYHEDGNRIIDEYEMEECLNIVKKGGNLNDFLTEKYLEANNLYGWAMSQRLPVKDFKWEKDSDDYLNIPEGGGCIIECDLEYTDKCKFKTKKYPLAPEKNENRKKRFIQLSIRVSKR